MKFATFFIIGLVVAACRSGDGRIANPADYETYLRRAAGQNASLAALDEELRFWETKLQGDPGNYVYDLKIARLLPRRFRLTGRVEDLHRADSLLVAANATLRDREPSVYFSLAQNAVTQHRFREARQHVRKAEGLLGKPTPVVRALTFDVALELGQPDLAGQMLHGVRDRRSFDYLIRRAKYEDHHLGNLDGAIELMEKALDEVRDNPVLAAWTLSNLGDLYGHANRPRDAYRAYLRVLELDPDDEYALKGIANIAFAHDRNPGAARRIYEVLLKKTALPDLYLKLAELDEFEGKTAERQAHLRQFTRATTHPRYGDMYNKYLILLNTETLGKPQQALALARREVANRPTPETYDLLAWALFHAGEKTKALAVARRYVEGKTGEPEAIYHLGCLYAGTDARKSREFLQQAAESSFELGPHTSAKIQNLMATR
jgi:tetratricopeptide (TPR) repeat protein